MWVGRFSATFAETLVTLAVVSLAVVSVGCLMYQRSPVKLAIISSVGLFCSEVIASIKKFDRGVWLGSFIIALTARLTSIIATFYLIQAVGVGLTLSTVFLI